MFGLSFLSFKQQSLKEVTYNYTVRGDHSEECVRTIYDNEKTSIDELIDLIGINDMGSVGFRNRFSSFLDLSEKYKGMNSAFMIEYIISNDEFRYPLIEYEGTELITKVEGIYQGLIVKASSPDQNLEYDDMVEIAKLYSGWWADHKNLPIVDIRAQWAAGDRPLSNSQYRWR